ncbi:FAD-dependent oxidoreductase [Vibrio panuliri]|uniref:Oxidoreductase n=1 Tax=Vibrio panuliri TaxID=1381081 RepID=A0ABX3FF98_9VIBR|nr:FAD-dependent oxidoreductase [Vibrio panuliri]KAB1457358.1 FAD-dependent oxidoreductase [Vibrio panuliri]OLQ91482.1 oxidoreductase [Vibrio panuliri]
MTQDIDPVSNPKVAVIGGGVAGATAALHLAELGVNVDLIEKKPSLVSGPPICHLHAGGNLYREISVEQCVDLLKQSIDSVRLYPHTVNRRPTLIVVPFSDGGDPQQLLPRLEQIRAVYKQLVDEDPSNAVLGNPEDYFTLYYREQLEQLKQLKQPEHPSSYDDWLIPFAQHADLDNIKYPVVGVNEYGWSVFRIAASAMLVLEQSAHCELKTDTRLVDMHWHNQQWQLSLESIRDGFKQIEQQSYDYVINACGFETGEIDDLAQAPRQRMVEFKAAYVTKWQQNNQLWPEVIFHGPRGTENGMAQLTPYANSVFQLHGMTKEITLFDDGLVSNCERSSQPKLPLRLNNKIEQGWSEQTRVERSIKAIQHMSRFVPSYASAMEHGLPLFGAQQIPGDDETLRAADVSFSQKHYARIEVVKGSSALEAIRKIVACWQLAPASQTALTIEELHPNATTLNADAVEEKAKQLAISRGYPQELAEVYGQ